MNPQTKQLPRIAMLPAVAFVALLPVVAQAQPSQFRKVEGAIPNQYVVVLNEAAGPRGALSQAPQIAAELVALYGGDILYVYKHALNGFVVRVAEPAAIALSQDPQVEYVSEDANVSTVETQYNPPWGLDRIDQRDRPLDGAYTYFNRGAGINAYVLDTGIRPTHQEFGGRAFIAADFVDDGQNGHDCNGHGTQDRKSVV